MMDGPQADSVFSAVFGRWIRNRLMISRGLGDPIEALSREDPRNVVATLKALAEFQRKHRTARSIAADLSTRLDIELVDAVTAFRQWMSDAPAEPTTLRLVAELEQLAQFYCDCLAEVPTFPRLWDLAHPPALYCMRGGTSDLKPPKSKSAWQKLAGRESGGELNSQVESLFTRVNAAYRALHGCIATRLCEVLSREISEVLDEYSTFKRAAAVLDFDDLLQYAGALVRDHENVRRALGERYRQILVDEFQDTDPLQAEILFRIASTEATSEWEQCLLRPGSLFMVGDPKQAIYRFRGADIDSYTRARNAIARPTRGILCHWVPQALRC
jgi:CRISPR-associated exonuclease Cas4